MRRPVPLLVAVLMVALISRANAQSAAGAFTRNEPFLAGAFALGTVAVVPFDELWGNRMQAPRLQGNAGLGATAKRVRTLGNPGAIVLTAALYAGRGPTTTAFAAASALTRELSGTHPRMAWLVGPLLYGGATAVGLSRMYDNKHWASDVIAGAAVGTLIGCTLVAHQHARPGNRFDRLLLPNAVEPSGRGMIVRWSLTLGAWR